MDDERTRELAQAGEAEESLEADDPDGTTRWPVRLIVTARALMIGVTYYLVVRLPGLTSSFVAILGALLAFDVYVALEHRRHTAVGVVRALLLTWPRALGTAKSLGKGLLVGLVFGLLHLLGLPYVLSAVATAGIAYTLSERTPANISIYVGLIGGLTVFESVAAQAGGEFSSIWRAALPVAASAVAVTSAALGLGLVIGTVSGLVTRLFLPRAFRSRQSEAYPYPFGGHGAVMKTVGRGKPAEKAQEAHHPTDEA